MLCKSFQRLAKQNPQGYRRRWKYIYIYNIIYYRCFSELINTLKSLSVTFICIWNTFSICHWSQYGDDFNWVTASKRSDCLPDSYKTTITDTTIFIYLLCNPLNWLYLEQLPMSFTTTHHLLPSSGSHRQHSRTHCVCIRTHHSNHLQKCSLKKIKIKQVTAVRYFIIYLLRGY